MTSLVTLKPPSILTTGSCHDNIDLHAERIDYTINNDIIQQRAGTTEGRVSQSVSSMVQINITGHCIPENGNTALENVEILECAARTWNDVAKASDVSETFCKINWRLGDQYMLFYKLTFKDTTREGDDRINYILTVFLRKELL